MKHMKDYSGINIGLLVASILILVLIGLLMSYCVENFGPLSASATFELPKKDKVANLQKLTTPIYSKQELPMPENISTEG